MLPILFGFISFHDDWCSQGIHQRVCSVCSPLVFCAFYKQLCIRYTYIYAMLYFYVNRPKHTGYTCM